MATRRSLGGLRLAPLGSRLLRDNWRGPYGRVRERPNFARAHFDQIRYARQDTTRAARHHSASARDTVMMVGECPSPPDV
jgi:hypothetical protein